MQTIIRQVIRASKEKLERVAGHFGLFGCDFLLDENFRLWLLEVNDNPGVGFVFFFFTISIRLFGTFPYLVGEIHK